MSNRRRTGLTALCALFAFVGLSACDVTEATDQGDDEDQGQQEVEIATQDVPATDASAAREYWTQERMQQAEALPVNGIAQDDPDPPAPTDPSVPGPDVQMQQTAGSMPELGIRDRTGGQLRRSGPQRSDSVVRQASQVSTTYTQYPYRAVGRVFFTKDGVDRSCSGAVIASENRSVVWTAGHCVSEQGNEDWHDRWTFVPAYQNANAPLGRWAARVKATFVAWHSGGNRNYDLGAAVVEQRDNRPIASVTGSLGWMFNATRDQDWRELGYPTSGSLFNGQLMWECSAPYAGGDGVGSNPGPRTSKIEACDYSGGSSGGPWVVAFDNCPQCYINGANSWWWWQRGHGNLAIQWASPYHGSAGLNLLRTAEGL